MVGSSLMKSSRQTTLRSQATVTGVGVHSGRPVNLTIGPADINAGFIFVRTGLDGADREIEATAKAVVSTELATVLGDGDGPLVSTAEHILAALRGMGIDNATIEVDGPEVPIMDGSAAPFVAAIEQAGIREQSAPRRFIQVLKPVQVAQGESFGELRPYAGGFRVEVEIDFTNPLIGKQKYALAVEPENFRREVARARTFGRMCDVARLWSMGYALGASFDNIRLAFRKGRIVEATSSNTKRLNEILDSDAGARYIGEFAIGFNPHILEPMRDILFDEKIAGSFHFTPGQAYENPGNGNKSQVHWDMVCIQRPEYGGGEIWFDGKLIRKDGLFVPKSLHKLNPDYLRGGK